MAESFEIGGHEIAPGKRMRLYLDVARLPTGDWLSLPIVVLNGKKPGPTVWLDAAIHGDELNGIEIIHQLLDVLDARRLTGRVLAVPIVNVFGFVQQHRYLPDRRDLNRSFPGTARGSLAPRLAHLFLTEIVDRCEYGIDFHTGSLHRTNMPQVRAELNDPETRRVAEAFGAPILYRAGKIRGSLRAAAVKRGKHILVYEAGEPMRFERNAIEVGVRGALRVLGVLGMWEAPDEDVEPGFEPSRTSWVRAGRSGIFHIHVGLGDEVEKGTLLGVISDVASRKRMNVRARFDGMVIGLTHNPLVYQGDALVHLARA